MPDARSGKPVAMTGVVTIVPAGAVTVAGPQPMADMA